MVSDVGILTSKDCIRKFKQFASIDSLNDAINDELKFHGKLFYISLVAKLKCLATLQMRFVPPWGTRNISVFWQRMAEFHDSG